MDIFPKFIGFVNRTTNWQFSKSEDETFKFGILADIVTGPIPDFFEPMSEEDLRLWEGGAPEPDN